jgi:hypothetical protein
MMEYDGDTRPANPFSRTSLNNIVLKFRANGLTLNPGFAVQHIGELNDLIGARTMV